MSIAAQAAGLAAGPEDAPGQPGTVPDDRTAVALHTAHAVSDMLHHLGHAAGRMRAARGASGDLRAHHSGHLHRHIQDALDAGHALTAVIREHYPAEADELEQVRQAVGLATGYDLSPRSGMISLDLPPGTVAPVPGGVDDHHVTVVYLGPDVDDEAFAAAQDRARDAAAAMPGPLSGTVGGIGTFPPSGSSDGKVPAWAGVVLPGAERLRSALEDLSASEHKDWKPHVTVAYVEPGEPLPPPVPATPVTFTHLSVHRGNDVTRFPLGGSATGLSGAGTVSSQMIGLAASLTPALKTATVAHLTETTLHEMTHAVRHAEQMRDPDPDDVWEFNADHAGKHLDGAAEHAGKLAQHFRDNYPDVARWLDAPETAGQDGGEPQHARYSKGTVSAQLANPEGISAQAGVAGRPKAGISSQLELAGGWQREQRDARGRWQHVGVPHDGTVTPHSHLGVKRADMPQLGGPDKTGTVRTLRPEFEAQLKRDGIAVSRETVRPSALKATQDELNKAKAEKLAAGVRSGDPAAVAQYGPGRPLIISSDNRVLDNHHKWAAAILNGDQPVHVLRVGMTASQALPYMRKFTAAHAMPNRAVTAMAGTVSGQLLDMARRETWRAEPRDAHGRWTRAPGAAGHAESLAKHTRPDGTLTPERAALHQQIIDGILAGHEPQDHPVATFLGGGPASGKSTVMGGGGGDTAQIDPDAIKAQLPEYREMVAAGDKRAAAHVHEESSHIARQAMKQAQDRKVSYTLDGTGDSDIAKLAGKVNEARRYGYSTEGRYVTVDTDEAVRRAAQRAARTGRMVPESVIREIHGAVSGTYAKAADMGLFDKTELWDNNGTSPKLIAHKQPGGTFTVDDPQAWARFTAKAAT